MLACSVVILAAGVGSRMRSKNPKVLHQICGREMLYYSLKEAQKISQDVSVILYHQAEEIQARIEKNFKNVHCVIQDHKNLPGTGGAILSFLKQYTPKNPHLLILNGDMPLIQNLEQFLQFSSKEIVMSVLQLADASGYGRVLIEKEQVKGIVEEKDADAEQKKITIANAGVYLFPCEVLQHYLPLLKNDNAQKEYYLTDVISLALKDKHSLKPLFVEEENYKGVNTKLDLSEAEEIMLERIRQKWLKEGVIMHQRKSIYIDEQAILSGECEIEAGVQIVGACEITDSLLRAHSVVESSLIEKSDIGPFAHVRPQSKIIHSHLGNFVETKKATLDNVKAGHLSYLGDCEIESGTNIGAGVITCNYDGKQKHKTRIGKNVFVGSDTQLVAPVVIEDDVLIGAGSTITKDIQKGSLALSRVAQTNKEGFFYQFFEPQKKIKINGEMRLFECNSSLAQILKTLDVDSKVLAIALNGEVVKKEYWEEVRPKEGDEVELLHFVGGGSFECGGDCK